MTRFAPKVAAVALLAAGLAGLTAAADPTPAPATDPGKTDWSGYVTVSTITGEVMKADATGVTVRVSWLVPQASKNSGSSRGRSMPRPQPPKQEHKDYDLKYADAGLARLKQMPVKTDENGKRASYSNKELQEIKMPLGAPGYALDRAGLKSGDIVEVTLVREKAIPAAKATEGDLKVKYAVVVGHDPDNGADASKK